MVQRIPLLFWLVCLWVGVCVSPALAADGLEPTVAVRWDRGLERMGQEAKALLPAIRRQVADRLGWSTDVAAEVAIVHDLGRMREEARAKVPAWAVGAALSAEGLIVVRADLLSAGQGSSLESVLRHEWVHLAWGARAGSNRRLLPLWAEEGIAEDLGGGISVDAGAALDVAAAFDRLHPFHALQDRFPADARGADLAYKQSRSWIQYVTRATGWQPIQEILDDLASWPADSPTPREEAFNRRVRARTGLSVGEWAAAWRQSVVEEARPWFHLLLHDVTGVILMVLAVIGAGAFVLLARRRRREIARLPDHEGVGDDPDRDQGALGG